MSVFLAAPYSLTQGTLIVAVVESFNAIGYSLPSNENTAVGAKVQTIPSDPTIAPSRGSSTTESDINVILHTIILKFLRCT
jgi:hypothetical protein